MWPAKAGFNRTYKRFSMKLNGGSTTHRFIWHRTSVRFQSLYGHRNDDLGQFAGWLYQPATPGLHEKPTPPFKSIYGCSKASHHPEIANPSS